MDFHKEKGMIHPHNEYNKKIHSDSVNSDTFVSSSSFDKHGKRLIPYENNESKMTFGEFIKSGRYLEDEIRKRSERKGGHFFDPDNMKHFSSRISELMWSKGELKNYESEPIYFITSEQDRNSRYTHKGSMRAFTIRMVDVNGNINTIGEFQGYDTLNDARHEIMNLINNNVDYEDES
jgi:hypothetical protein